MRFRGGAMRRIKSAPTKKHRTHRRLPKHGGRRRTDAGAPRETSRPDFGFTGPDSPTAGHTFRGLDDITPDEMGQSMDVGPRLTRPGETGEGRPDSLSAGDDLVERMRLEESDDRYAEREPGEPDDRSRGPEDEGPKKRRPPRRPE